MKKLLGSLALLGLLCGCHAENNTDTELSEVFNTEYDFNSIEEMDRYLDDHDTDSELLDKDQLLEYMETNTGKQICVESEISKINSDNFTINQDSITCNPSDPAWLQHLEVGEDITLYGTISNATTIDVSGYED